LDYEKIQEDTGFDLLSEQSSNDSTPTRKRSKPSSGANVPKVNIAISNFGTLECSDLAHSSIYKENHINTTHTEGVCEKKMELAKEEENTMVEYSQEEEKLTEENREDEQDSNVDQCSEGEVYKTLKSSLVVTEIEPKRPPMPKYMYPEGPWLTENGRLNKDFVKDRANVWRTGDNPKSKSFGAMTIEDVMGYVCSYYAKSENHVNLTIHWDAYVAKSQRYVENVRCRVENGIKLPIAEEKCVLAKLPAVLSDPVESVYEDPVFVNPPHDDRLLASKPESPIKTIDVYSQSTPMPEDGENYQAYRTNVDLDQVEWMKRFTPENIERSSSILKNKKTCVWD
jgi:hypothetical protein